MVETREIDGRLVTFRREEGRGPSLICIHGSAHNHAFYDAILDAMPERLRFAINLPGRAGTDGPALGSVAEMEAFLRRFLDSEVEGDYVIVGHSLGGAVALEHALSSPPRRLKGIVLLATGARLRVHPKILQLFEGVAEPGEVTPIEAIRMDWRAADTFDRMQDLGNIRVPALIVVGTEDALTPPKYAAYLAVHIPENDLRVIEGAGHMLPVEHPTEVSEMIEQFIADL